MVFADLKNDIRHLVTAAHAEGKVEAVLAILATRGTPVGDETLARITNCTGPEILDRWIARAATAASAEEVVGTAPAQPTL